MNAFKRGLTNVQQGVTGFFTKSFKTAQPAQQVVDLVKQPTALEKFDYNNQVAIGLMVLVVLFMLASKYLTTEFPAYARVFKGDEVASNIFRAVAFAVIVYVSRENPLLGLLAAFAMLTTMYYANMQNVEKTVPNKSGLDAPTPVLSTTPTPTPTEEDQEYDEYADYVGGELESVPEMAVPAPTTPNPAPVPVPLPAPVPQPVDASGLDGYDLPLPDRVGLGSPVESPFTTCPIDQQTFASIHSMKGDSNISDVQGYDETVMQF